MSNVINLIFVFSPLEEKAIGSDRDGYALMDNINGWLVEHRRPGFGKTLRQHAGGNKFFIDPLYAGTFNYFFLDEFLEHLRELPWRSPEQVQLFIKREEDAAYIMCNVFSSEPSPLQVQEMMRQQDVLLREVELIYFGGVETPAEVARRHGSLEAYEQAKSRQSLSESGNEN